MGHLLMFGADLRGGRQVLAGLDTLTVEQASHALRLLRVHHRQIPEALREGLFPTAQPTLSFSPAA